MEQKPDTQQNHRESSQERPEQTEGALPVPETSTVQKNEGKETEVFRIPQPKEENGEGGLVRRIRTYKEDILEAIKRQNTSLTSATAAEERRRTRTSKSIEETAPRKLDYQRLSVISGSVLFILLGIGLLGFFLFFYEPPKVSIEEEIPSLIFAEEHEGIDVTGKDTPEIVRMLGELRRAVSLPLGQVTQVYLTELNPDTGEQQIISAEEFLQKVGARVSDAFLRSLSPDYMVGIHVFNQNQPFMIFKSESYQHSFAGMLEWERSIYDDLFPFMGRGAATFLEIPKNPLTGENTPLKTAFEDKVIQNIDTRVLLNETGGIEFLYAFPDRETLIITTNENSLTEVITRLRTVRIF